jgi:hypothetical protein
MGEQERPWYFEAGEDDWQWGRAPRRRLSQLDLNPIQRAQILEWLAFKIWVAGVEGAGDGDYHSKSYDPLTIELDSWGGGVAHSYVFNFHDGGRHHTFHSLDELEDWLFEEAINIVKWAGDSEVEV